MEGPKINNISFMITFALIIFTSPRVQFAQITVTQSEFMTVFSVGDPLFVVNGESGAINIGGTDGPNIYDFTSLSLENQIVLHNYSVSQIPILATHYPTEGITFGEDVQNIVTNPIFLSKSDSTLLLGEVTTGDEYILSHYKPYALFAIS